MNQATAIPNAFIPSAHQLIEGRFWLLFHNDGTIASYKAMPNALRFQNKTYIKAGWNSDLNTVHYKEGEPAVAA